MANGPTQIGTPHQASIVQVTRSIASGRFEEAAKLARRLSDEPSDELDGPSRGAYLLALAEFLVSSRSTLARIEAATSIVKHQQAWRWDDRLRLIGAAAAEDGPALAKWMSDATSRILLTGNPRAGRSHWRLAAPTGPSTARTHPLDGALPRPMETRLVRQLRDSGCPSANVAAKLLTDIGHTRRRCVAGGLRTALSARWQEASAQSCFGTQSQPNAEDPRSRSHNMRSVRCRSQIVRRTSQGLRPPPLSCGTTSASWPRESKFLRSSGRTSRRRLPPTAFTRLCTSSAVKSLHGKKVGLRLTTSRSIPKSCTWTRS